MEINSSTINTQTELERIKTINNFLEKSEEAFLLAVEIMNKPTIKYRIETYSYLITNAWELLLKALIISRGEFKDILFKDNQARTISLSVCLQKLMKENNPIRKNLEFIEKNIRDISTHNIIPYHEAIYIPILQAAAINYARYREIVFNDKKLNKIKLFHWSSLYDDVDFDKVEQEYGINIRQQLEIDKNKAQEFMNSIQIEEVSPFMPFAYIETKISEVRNPNNADVPYVIEQTGYVGLKLQELVIDALFDNNKYNPVLVLNKTVPTLIPSKASVPLFYYYKKVQKKDLICQVTINYIKEKEITGFFSKSILKSYVRKNIFTETYNDLENYINNGNYKTYQKLQRIVQALHDKPEIFNTENFRSILQNIHNIDTSVISQPIFRRLVMYIDMME